MIIPLTKKEIYEENSIGWGFIDKFWYRKEQK